MSARAANELNLSALEQTSRDRNPYSMLTEKWLMLQSPTKHNSSVAPQQMYLHSFPTRTLNIRNFIDFRFEHTLECCEFNHKMEHTRRALRSWNFLLTNFRFTVDVYLTKFFFPLLSRTRVEQRGEMLSKTRA